MSSFIMSQSQFDIAKIKFYLQSSRFRDLIGASKTAAAISSIVTVNPLILSKTDYPLMIPLTPSIVPVSSTSQIIENLPAIIQSMRYCIKKRRESTREFNLFLKGVLVPGKTVHVDYIQDKIKNFLNEERKNDSQLTDYITLFGRLMNGKWKQPFRNTRILTPTTREVIKSLTKAYHSLFQIMFSEKVKTVDHPLYSQQIDIIESKHSLNEVTDFIRNDIASDSNRTIDMNTLPRRYRETITKYITHNLAEVYNRAILLLIDLSIATTKMPSDWSIVITCFVSQCKTNTIAVERPLNTLIADLNHRLAAPEWIEKYNHKLPVSEYKGDRYAVVPATFAVIGEHNHAPNYLNGPREKDYYRWYSRSISPYVTSIFPIDVSEETDIRWNTVHHSKSMYYILTIQYVLT
jgi:hypothetical protein